MGDIVTGLTISETTERAARPFWAKCSDCGHCWPVAYLPMNMTAMAKLGKAARCPMGCRGKPLVAKQDNGVLNEPTPGVAA